MPARTPQRVPLNAEVLPPDSKHEAVAFAASASSPNTRRAYRADLEDFAVWCKHRRKAPLPADPDVVALYLRTCAEGLKISTVTRRLAALNELHRGRGLAAPGDAWVVRNTMRRLRRELGVPAKAKAPLLTGDLKKIVALLPASLAGVRDRALLLLGFAGAMRRRELVELDFEDVGLTDEGLVIMIRHGKTDQVREGRKIGIPFGTHEETCPVRALGRWLAATNISSGPIFRGFTKHGHVRATRLTDQVVAAVVKKYVSAIGKDPKRFAGHSLRAGLATAAAIAGVSERAIQDQTGHKSLLMLRRYIRDGSLFRDNAAGKVGL